MMFGPNFGLFSSIQGPSTAQLSQFSLMQFQSAHASSVPVLASPMLTSTRPPICCSSCGPAACSACSRAQVLQFMVMRHADTQLHSRRHAMQRTEIEICT